MSTPNRAARTRCPWDSQRATAGQSPPRPSGFAPRPLWGRTSIWNHPRSEARAHRRAEGRTCARDVRKARPQSLPGFHGDAVHAFMDGRPPVVLPTRETTAAMFIVTHSRAGFKRKLRRCRRRQRAPVPGGQRRSAANGQRCRTAAKSPAEGPVQTFFPRGRSDGCNRIIPVL